VQTNHLHHWAVAKLQGKYIKNEMLGYIKDIYTMQIISYDWTTFGFCLSGLLFQHYSKINRLVLKSKLPGLNGEGFFVEILRHIILFED